MSASALRLLSLEMRTNPIITRVSRTMKVVKHQLLESFSTSRSLPRYECDRMPAVFHIMALYTIVTLHVRTYYKLKHDANNDTHEEQQ